MNTKSIRVLMLLLVWTLGITQILAYAEPFLDTSGVKASADDSKPTLGVTPGPIIRLSESDTALFNIRCWQNGQLILEESNWSEPQLASHYIALRKVNSPAPGIYLIDFQHTFCELKRH